MIYLTTQHITETSKLINLVNLQKLVMNIERVQLLYYLQDNTKHIISSM